MYDWVDVDAVSNLPDGSVEYEVLNIDTAPLLLQAES